MCEFCGTSGTCAVCGYDRGDSNGDDDGAIAVLTDLPPSADPLLEAARLGRLAARSGEPYDNPYPPGSSEYGWFGGAYLDASL